MLSRSLALVLALAGLLVLAAPAPAERFVAGAPGAGDPFFPLAGNGGYDVAHYSLAVEYAPGGQLSGRVAVFARATQDLDRFDLDLRDLYAVARVTVDGRPATFAHAGQELAITPRERLRRGRFFIVGVRWAGTPQPVVDPDDSIEGWVPTDDGAYVVNEPQGAPGWFPVNDTPRDKATYDIAVTVPSGSTAIGNGVLVARTRHGSRTTWRWVERAPMASYLVTATNGTFETRFGRAAGGLVRYDAVDPQTRVQPTSPPNPAFAWERLAPEDEIVAFFSDLYGAYPFESFGGIVDWAPDVGYALESQTRPNYDSIPGASTVVHELSHQWWGDALTPARWPDIWLNEGFATWSEWIYAERHGGDSAHDVFDEHYATPQDSEAGQDLWFPAPAALPDASVLFSTPVYDRGAMTLQALRAKVGDGAFFALLREWYRRNRGGNVTTADFIALAERVTHQPLDRFFNAWLYTPGRPTAW